LASPAKFDVTPGDYILTVYVKGYINWKNRLCWTAREQDAGTVLKEARPEGMVLIPPGPFIMGLNGASPDEKPQREIDLPASISINTR